MPTTARRSESGFFSAISWAIRRSVRLRSSCSSTTFSFTSVASFLASRDRVKGRGECSSGGGVAMGQATRGRGPRRTTAGRVRRGPLPLVVRFPGSVWDQVGVSSLRERQFDLVEIFRGYDRLEDLPCLLDDLADVVAGGDVDEG